MADFGMGGIENSGYTAIVNYLNGLSRRGTFYDVGQNAGHEAELGRKQTIHFWHSDEIHSGCDIFTAGACTQMVRPETRR
jgi:hypothetical protein